MQSYNLEEINEELKRKQSATKKENNLKAIFAEMEKKIKSCQFCGSELIDFRCNCLEFKDYEEKLKQEEIEDQKKEQKKREFKNVAFKENCLNYLKIPKRYIGASVKDWDFAILPALRSYMNTLAVNIDNGYGLTLQGLKGTGKTRMSFAIALYILNEVKAMMFKRVKLYDVVSELINNKENGLDRLNNLKGIAGLIIDDVGTKQLTEWEQQILYSIIDYRSENMLYTIITTNLFDEDLENCIGARSVDRLKENSLFVEFKSKSRRLKK